jgi:predicted pyridoxine 5'-phosphate oxidase superfamily flavin-nucleotide-binding protein
MTNSGWSKIESPFHAGELAIHTRLGALEQVDKQGRRVIRDHLPDQFRQFFAQLCYVMVGTVDTRGHPWASILIGTPGFLSTPDERTLKVVAQPLFGDPLVANLTKGIDIGFLGIELSSRRRNRMNGIVIATHPDGFEVQVKQSFGNCPQYIQARRSEWDAVEPSAVKSLHWIEHFGGIEHTLITTADTFFIATSYQAESAGAASGVDVSHRGGKPGFARIEDSRTLTIPDYSGNHHFNTFGNLELNPHAGLLFIDFLKGSLLYLTGTAEVIWEGTEILTHSGAERLLRFHLQNGYRVEGSLPLRWSDPEFSPFLAG